MLSLKTISQFKEFIEEARNLTQTPKSLSAPRPQREAISEFRTFIADAKPVAVNVIRETLRAYRNHLENLCRWIVPESCDILSVSGLRGEEDPYTNLIAWMLSPKGEPALALRCQQAWLKAIGLTSLADNLSEAAEPKTQVVTDDGRPDLVMHFRRPEFILIVEAKIATEEHSTPNSDWQTNSYPSAVRRKLGVSPDHPGAMVFLTPDGREAASAEAIVTTYETLVTAIAEILAPDDLPPRLASAYAHVITNLLTHAAPGGINRAYALQKLSSYLLEGENALSDERILENLGTLGALCQSLSSKK